MAFDPKFPSAYYVNNSYQSNQNQSFRFILSDDGTGCNSEETSALYKLLDARDEYYTTHKEESVMDMREARRLSRKYRQILLECQTLWRDRLNLNQREISDENDHGGDSTTMEISEDYHTTDILRREEGNLALFESTLGILQLSEIYLLGPTQDGDNFDEINTSGIVTADTVRFLRQNYMQSAFSSIQHLLPQSMSLDEFLSQTRPEDYTPLHREQNLTPFWILIRKLVIRGCLEETWDILKTHSVFRRCEDCMSQEMITSTPSSTLSNDYEAFHLTKILLLTAPLPGGINSLDDSGLFLLDDFEEKSIEMYDQESYENISSFSFKLWDIDFDNSKKLSNQPTSEFTASFNIHMAYKVYTSWKKSMINKLKTNVILLNRIPALKTCIWDLILYPSDNLIHTNDSWSEILAYELIYIQPDIKKEDVHIRWSAAINRRITEKRMVSILDVPKLIMEGNASIALECLHTWGGKSGAALPSLQTCLFCDLLTKTNRIQPFVEDYDLHTELLLHASSSIISSFASQFHHHIGIHISTRLLLPYADPDNNRVNAQLSEHLSHHYPKSDDDADSLISLCRPLIDLGSRRLLDACELFTSCRAQYHERTGQMKTTAFWLLKGINLYCKTANDSNKETFPVILSANFFKLLSLCLRQSDKLLYSYVSKDPKHVVEELLRQSQEVVHAIQMYDVNEKFVSHLSFSLLSRLISLGTNWIREKYVDAAADIVCCIDNRLNSDGTVFTLAHPFDLGRYLALAYVILKIEEENTASQFTNMTASFDVYGIKILMMRFTRWQSFDTNGYIVDDRKKREMSAIPPNEMREALAKGLMRAFVAENAELRVETSLPKANSHQ
jgi:hypothetical protein